MAGVELISHRNEKAQMNYSGEEEKEEPEEEEEEEGKEELEEYFEDELEEYMDGTYRLGNVESCQW